MVRTCLAIVLGCWYIALQGGSSGRTGVAPPTTFGETTFTAGTTHDWHWTLDSWSSTARTEGGESIACSSHLESGGANKSSFTPDGNYGLALQEMPDPAVGFQRALLQVWSSLEQGLANQIPERQISQQTEASATFRGPGGRGYGNLFHKDSMGCVDTQLTDQQCDIDAIYQPFNGGHPGRHCRGHAATRTSVACSTGDGQFQALGTSSWTTTSYGQSSNGACTKAPSSGGKRWRAGDQIESWPSQQDGEDPTPNQHRDGEDHEAGSRLASLRIAGRGEVSQTPKLISADPGGVDRYPQKQDGRTRNDQGRDLQGFSNPTPSPCRGQRCTGGVGRPGADGIFATSGQFSGDTRRVPGDGGRYRDGPGWQTGGTGFPEALGAFLEAIGEGVVIPQTDPTQHLQTVVSAMLRHTWAKVPGSDRYILPRTGSRPGDPLADTLFGFLMAKALHGIAQRFDAEGLTTTWDGTTTIAPAITCVDDAIFHIEAPAAQLHAKTICALRILHEEMLRLGLRLNYETGKTEVLTCFWGRHSTQAAQKFFKQEGGVFQVWNEFDGVLTVRAVPHYKHLGGFITRTMSLHPELRVRRAQMHQQLHGLKHSALSDPVLPMSKRQALLQSLGITVLTLHAGVWRPLRKCEWKAWQGATTSAYQYLHKRQCDGQVAHQTTLALAVAADSPMPHALLYLRRLRVFTALCRLGPGIVLENILCNHRLCGPTSWLHGILEALQWARANADDYDWIPELDAVEQRSPWDVLHGVWWQLRRLFRKVEQAHKLRNKMCLDLQILKAQQDDILRQQGWTRPECWPEAIPSEFRCPTCGYAAGSQAALGVHEHKKHGVRVAARRFAKGSTCVACSRTFHTRPRLVLHLQYGTTRCLIHLLRHTIPLTLDESLKLDAEDVAAGQALHQKGLRSIAAQQPFFETDDPSVTKDVEDVTAEELQQWTGFGSLPAWMIGREPEPRSSNDHSIVDAIEELSACEAKWFQEAAEWIAPTATVPRPLSESRLFSLVFFSGHRRYGDLISWIEWTCDDLVPLPIDLAIDPICGDARKGGLWADLIREGRVAGAHFGPPCETYTDARWLEVLEEVHRRLPRRDYGWGMPRRSIKELRQVETGNHLLWLAVYYMILLDGAGGSATLEHPRGQAPRRGRFSFWTSARVRRALRSKDWDVTTFLQGPLGVPYAKPTRILHLRLPGLARALYSAYDPSWRPTQVLGGRSDDGSWKTTVAKAYPMEMNRVLCQVHWDFIRSRPREGFAEDSTELHEACSALSAFWDPYVLATKGAFMASDYHG